MQCGHPPAVEPVHTIVWPVQCFVVLLSQLFVFHVVDAAISLTHDPAMPFGRFGLLFDVLDLLSCGLSHLMITIFRSCPHQ